MNTSRCCQIQARAGDDVRRPASRFRRAGELVGWMVPSATLILIPKCPVCVAAYVALFSGVGISVATATYLRVSLLILCAVSLLYLGLRRWRRSRTKGRAAL
jgi:hypothetical protein